MIILDLEWNRSYENNVALEEVLQIGAVRLEELGGKMTGTFNAFIKPTVHKKFSRPAKQLPALSNCLASDLDFPAAMTAFRQWCGEEREFGTWGGGDVEVLNQNCTYWQLPTFEPEQVYDFQGAFSLILGASDHLALCSAVEYCQIPASFAYHNALYDAVYTAAVGEWLNREALILQGLPRSIWRLAHVNYPPQACQTVGPFASRKAVLDGKSSRKPACPICGVKEWVQCWYSSDPLRYFAYFQCREHGRFLCQLSIAQAENGAWHGELSVPTLTMGLLQEFGAAAGGGVYQCRRRSKKYHRRSRRKKPLGPD